MSCGKLIKAILDISKARFIVAEQSRSKYLTTLAYDDLFAKEVITLKKSNAPEGGNKTLLIACFDSVENLDFGARWAAEVRDVLPEPEASDLYLILSAKGLSEGECSRLESDEQFCRKYVLRPGEEPSEFVMRTFLCPLESNNDGLNLSDPVIAAMKFAEAENDWLDAQQQDYWKELFLSSLESTDIARLLLDDGAPEE